LGRKLPFPLSVDTKTSSNIDRDSSLPPCGGGLGGVGPTHHRWAENANDFRPVAAPHPDPPPRGARGNPVAPTVLRQQPNSRGIDPAIQAPRRSRISRLLRRPRFRDGRVKPGHDEAAALILAPMGSSPAMTANVFRNPDLPPWGLPSAVRSQQLYIGIGGGLAAPPLPHHRAYGSVHGGSVDYAFRPAARV